MECNARTAITFVSELARMYIHKSYRLSVTVISRIDKSVAKVEFALANEVPTIMIYYIIIIIS